MISALLSKALLLALFTATFGSFVWGMARFFRVAGTSPGLQMIRLVGGALMIVQFVALCWTTDWALMTSACAAALYLAALGVFWAATAAHGGHRPAICYTTHHAEQLVTSGPYRWVRHPFYLAYLLAWIAGPLATRQWWLLSSAVLMGVLYLRAALLEERGFGDSALAAEFAAYRRRTGMFLPRLLGWRR